MTIIETKANIIATELDGMSALDTALIMEQVFVLRMNATPEPEHPNYEVEMENVGILIGHDVNEVTTSKGICKRKKNPNNE